VTITVANGLIAGLTRRLDVLPGDFNDDGVVGVQDAFAVRNEWLRFNGAVPTIFGDINGDGVVDGQDYNAVRAAIGTSLPGTGAGGGDPGSGNGGPAVVVRIEATSRPTPSHGPAGRASAAWSSPRAEVRLTARGRGWSPAISSRTRGIDRAWPESL
jgi:hypothetical protein